MLEKMRMPAIRAIKNLIAFFYFYSGVHNIHNKGKVLILTFHRILKDDDDDISFVQPGMYVTLSTFEKQMAYLSKWYELISIDDMVSKRRNGTLDPVKRYCVVTLDDGWLDNYQNAFPVLRKYKIPATIFLVTSYIDTDQWFWPELLSNLLRNAASLDFSEKQQRLDQAVLNNCPVHASIVVAILNPDKTGFVTSLDSTIEKLKPFSEGLIRDRLRLAYELLGFKYPDQRILLNWEEVKEMSSYRISFGSHTCTHKILTNTPIAETVEELSESLRHLTERNVNQSMVFCYPNGNYSDAVKKAVKNCGYIAALSTVYGTEALTSEDDYAMKRLSIHEDVSLTTPLFVARISGVYKVIERTLARILLRQPATKHVY